MGVSYGSGTAAALAEHVPERVRSLQLIVPAWPCMATHSLWAEAPFPLSLLAAPFIDRIYSYYISKFDISFKEVLTALFPEETKELLRLAPALLDLLDREYKRSTQYHHEGACEVSGIIRTKGIQIYEKRDILVALGSRVSVWYGLNDTIVRNHGPEFVLSMLPKAKSFSFEKGHVGMLIDLDKYFEEMKNHD